MPLLQKSLRQQAGEIVLLSIKPKYADLILAGVKRVEFRRSWASKEVSTIVIYSSSPVQKIVGMVEINDVVSASPKALWSKCAELGGGLTKGELRTYFAGKSKGVALLLGRVYRPSVSIQPRNIIDNFVAPQSFRYLSVGEYSKLQIQMIAKRNKR